MDNKWSETTTMKFLYRYKRHECLWNPNHKFYHVRKMRDSAYKDIAKDMQIGGLDVKGVKVSVKRMRTQYFSERKKVQKGIQTGQHYEPSLYWYRECDLFLGPTIISHKHPTLQNTEMITGDSIFDSSRIYENEDPGGKATPIFHQPEKPSRPTLKPRAPRLAPPAPPNPLSVLPPPPSAPKRPAEHDTRKRKRTNNKRPKPTEDDEFETFGFSVASQLRKLSVSRALKAQSRIQTILTEERIKDLEAASQKTNEDEVQPIPFHPATSGHNNYPHPATSMHNNNNNQFLHPVPFLPAAPTHHNPYLHPIPVLLAAPTHTNNFPQPMNTSGTTTDPVPPFQLPPDTSTHNNFPIQPPPVVENIDADSTSSGFNENNNGQKNIVSYKDSSNSGVLKQPSPPPPPATTTVEDPAQSLTKAIKEIEDIKSKYSIQSDLIIKPEYEIITLDEEDPLAGI